jgi:hypothetical protein
MKLKSARVTLAIMWLAASVIYMFMLFLKGPELGNEAEAVLKKGSTFVAPCLALALTFFFGGGQETDKAVASVASFWAAVGISVVNIVAVYYSTFAWTEGVLKNMKTAEIFLSWFGAITIFAMNFFFVGTATKPGETTPPAPPDPVAPAPPRS